MTIVADSQQLCAILLGNCLLLVLAGSGGCIAIRDGHLSSRWAMSDPDYQRKYSQPHEPGEKYPRMLKQSVDARHVKGTSGMYVDWLRSSKPADGGAIGVYSYPTSWLETRGGVGGMQGADTYEALALGVDGGIRIQSPSRIAPFVGVGGFAGWTATRNRPKRTNDDDDPPDDPFDEDDDDDWFDLLLAASFRALYENTEPSAGIYPEIGCHYWVTERHRVTGFARYYLSDSGEDFLLLGMEYGGATAKDPEPTEVVLSDASRNWLQSAPQTGENHNSTFVMDARQSAYPTELPGTVPETGIAVANLPANPTSEPPDFLQKQSPFDDEPAEIQFATKIPDPIPSIPSIPSMPSIPLLQHEQTLPQIRTATGTGTPGDGLEFRSPFQSENVFR